MAIASIGKPAGRRVFISYARNDGAIAAHSLRDALQDAGCDVWLDTDRIGGGVSWSKKIEDSLDSCNVLVAVLTPVSFVSEICRAEQIWALDKRKTVIPVLISEDLDVVPIHLKGFVYRKLPEQEAELLRDLAGELTTAPPIKPRPLRYDTIPNLPQNYIVREADLTKLRDLVFMEGAGGNIAAVSGMGGIGKTVLATALCRDMAVQRAFPDGIAWITAGREWDGNFVTRMREVARALGDDLGGYDNALACENRYRTILRDKAALVVLDDVWNLEHLKPMLVDAPRSRFLFTTRDTGIAKAVSQRRFSASLLTSSEARDLLARWSGADPLPPEAPEIIRKCGDLALAVAQVGAALSDLSPIEWRDMLHALDHADIGAIEERLPPGQQSFFKTLAVSFHALPEQKQTRYLKLAVLLEDAAMPLPVLQILWKASASDARGTARYLVDRSLAFWEDAKDTDHGLRLHDLQLDYVRARFADQHALSLIHGALRLSAHVVASHPEEFSSQMVGRLLPYAESEAVSKFTRELAEGTQTAWLNPLWPALHPPGTNLVRTIETHSLGVKALSVTSDGKRLLSASFDREVRVWDLETGSLLRKLEGHSDTVDSVVATKDGRLALSACADKTLKVWDLDTGDELFTLGGHSEAVNGVAVTPDGRRAVSASDDKKLKVWDLQSGTELRTLVGHSAPVYGVAVTPDGKRALSSSSDRTLKVWDLESGSEIHSLVGHQSIVSWVTITPDGRRAVSASYDKTVKVWDLETGATLRTLAGHTNLLNCVVVTPDGKRAVSACSDSTLKVWDLETGREIHTLAGHSSVVWGVVVTPDGKQIVSASHDGTLKVWDLESGRDLRIPTGHSGAVNSLAVMTNGKHAVSASDDHTLEVWDLEKGRGLRTLSGHSSFVRGVAVTPDGKRAVSGSRDQALIVWDLETGAELRRLVGHSDSIEGVAVTADGKLAIAACFDKTLRVWDLETGRALHTLVGHTNIVSGVAVTGDGKRAVSASLDSTLKMWDLETGTELLTMVGHTNVIYGVAVTPDGRRAVSASYDKTLKVWDLENGSELRTLVGHAAQVRGVAVSVNGRHVVSASEDKTLKVWELETGHLMATFHCEGSALSCAFVDNRRIIAGDEGGRLYLLSLQQPAP